MPVRFLLTYKNVKVFSNISEKRRFPLLHNLNACLSCALPKLFKIDVKRKRGSGRERSPVACRTQGKSAHPPVHSSVYPFARVCIMVTKILDLGGEDPGLRGQDLDLGGPYLRGRNLGLRSGA